MTLETRLIKLVQAALQDSDRAKKYRGSPNPMHGHCYVACEALYYLLKSFGRENYKLCWVKHEGDTHFFLYNKDSGVTLDPTVTQFKTMPPPYSKGRGCGFLTKQPSKRTKVVLDRIQYWQETGRLTFWGIK